MSMHPNTDTPAIDAGRPLPDAEIAPARVDTAAADDVKPRRSRSGGRKRKPATAAADKPPRSRSGSRGPTKAQQRERISTTVAAVHELAGGMVLPAVGRPGTGAALRSQAQAAGDWWAKLAERYPAVARLFAATGDGLLFVEGALVYYPIIAAAMAEQRGESVPVGDAANPLSMLAGLAGMTTPPAAEQDATPDAA